MIRGFCHVGNQGRHNSGVRFFPFTSPGHTTLASAHGSPTASTPSTLTGILISTSPAPKGLVELVFMIDLFYWARINFRGSNSQEEMPFYLGGRRLLRFFLYDDCFTD